MNNYCSHMMQPLGLSLIFWSTLVLLANTAAGFTSLSAVQDHAAYTIEKTHISMRTSACIPAFLYVPSQPITRPPGAVVMIPALGQNALHSESLHDYAHAFASNGIVVVVLSAPGSLLSSSNDTKETQFLLHCGRKQQQQHKLVAGVMLQANGLFGAGTSSYRKAVIAYLKQLGDEGRIDSSRIALWGAEWGAVAAVQASLDSAAVQVQLLLLQTPMLTASRAQTWRWLKAKGWLHVIRYISLAAVDWLSGLLIVDEKFRLPGRLLSGPQGSEALLQLQPNDLELHRLAVAADLKPTTPTITQSALLDVLVHDNPIHRLLPRLNIPVAFYAAAGDSDTPIEQYVAASKTAKYVGFHVSPGSRYGLLAGREEDRNVLEDVILDQTMILIALLGDADSVSLMSAAQARQQMGQEQQEQQFEQVQVQHSGTTANHTDHREIDPSDELSSLQQAADGAVATGQQGDSKQCPPESAASSASQL